MFRILRECLSSCSHKEEVMPRETAPSPAFPGCYSQGETVGEALANAREAIELTTEDMLASGEPIPDPAGELVGKVAVGA